MDFGQFWWIKPTNEDKELAHKQASEFYGNAPRVVDAPCGAKAVLDMDGLGYRCTTCFTVVGSMGCPCK